MTIHSFLNILQFRNTYHYLTRISRYYQNCMGYVFYKLFKNQIQAKSTNRMHPAYDVTVEKRKENIGINDR